MNFLLIKSKFLVALLLQRKGRNRYAVKGIRQARENR